MPSGNFPTRGMHTHRLKDNEVEKALSDEWHRYQSDDGRSPSIGYILSKSNKFKLPSDEACTVAATVIQWIGSPVGFAFLEKSLSIAGYKIEESYD